MTENMQQGSANMAGPSKKIARYARKIHQIQNTMSHHCIYTSKTLRVDGETGEEITKWRSEQKTNGKPNYIKYKTHKKINYNANRTKGFIEYTIEYRQQPQLRIWE